VLEPEYVAARRVLLDALDALGAHRDGLVLVGAQAIYLHTGEGDLAVAPYTTDGDLALDPARLSSEPALEDAMRLAGFRLDEQPGIWRGAGAVEIDLLVPEAVGGGGTRGARLGVHGNRAARKARGLEAALVDNAPSEITALEQDDDRVFALAVAGPAALLVAKLHKLADRRNAPGRLDEKNALGRPSTSSRDQDSGGRGGSAATDPGRASGRGDERSDRAARCPVHLSGRRAARWRLAPCLRSKTQPRSRRPRLRSPAT
jgi:hypothetical protein